MVLPVQAPGAASATRFMADTTQGRLPGAGGVRVLPKQENDCDGGATQDVGGGVRGGGEAGGDGLLPQEPDRRAFAISLCDVAEQTLVVAGAVPQNAGVARRASRPR